MFLAGQLCRLAGRVARASSSFLTRLAESASTASDNLNHASVATPNVTLIDVRKVWAIGRRQVPTGMVNTMIWCGIRAA